MGLPLVDEIVGQIMDLITVAKFDKITGPIANTISGLIETSLKDATKVITPVATAITEAVKPVATTVSNNIKTGIEPVAGTIVKTVSDLLSTMISDIGKALPLGASIPYIDGDDEFNISKINLYGGYGDIVKVYDVNKTQKLNMVSPPYLQLNSEYPQKLGYASAAAAIGDLPLELLDIADYRRDGVYDDIYNVKRVPLGADFSAIGDTLAKIANAVANPFMTTVTTALTTTIIPTLTKLISSFIPLLAESLGTTTTTLLEALRLLQPVLTDVATRLLKIVVDVINGTIPTIKDGVKALIPAVTDAIKTLIPTLGTVVSELVPVIIDSLEIIGTTLYTNLKSTGTTIVYKFASVMRDIASRAPSLGGAPIMTPRIGGSLKGHYERRLQLGKSVEAERRTIAKKILKRRSKSMKLGATSDPLGDILDGITGIAKFLSTGLFKDVISKVGVIGGDLLEGIRQKVMSFYNTYGPTIYEKLKTFGVNIGGQIYKYAVEYGGPLLEKIGVTGASALSMVMGMTRNLIRSIMTNVINVVNMIVINSVSQGKTLIIDNILNQILQVLNKLQSVVLSTVRTVVRDMMKLLKTMLQQGLDAVQSTGNGIMDAFDSISSRIFDTAKSSMNNVLDIRNTLLPKLTDVKSTALGTIRNISTELVDTFADVFSFFYDEMDAYAQRMIEGATKAMTVAGEPMTFAVSLSNFVRENIHYILFVVAVIAWVVALKFFNAI